MNILLIYLLLFLVRFCFCFVFLMNEVNALFYTTSDPTPPQYSSLVAKCVVKPSTGKNKNKLNEQAVESQTNK